MPVQEPSFRWRGGGRRRAKNEGLRGRTAERVEHEVAGPHARERRRHEGERRVHRRRASVTSVRDAVLAQHIGGAAAGYYSSYHNFLASHKHGHVFLRVLEPHGTRERVQDASELLAYDRVVGVHEARASSGRLDSYSPRRAVGKRTVWRYACS